MKIPHNKPSIDKNEAKAIEEVLECGWIAQGDQVGLFENKICDYMGFEDNSAVALSNGTSALFLALKLLGIKSPTDEVVLPNYVCSALLNAIFMNNAKPIVVDVDKVDFNISYDEVKKKINEKTKAIIVPHIFGVPADVIRIRELGIPIIEDCAQALGSKINNTHVGLFGDIAILSFYATKLITTGQGGMLVSKNSEYIEKAKDYREHDMRKEYYPRFNFQMTDIQAAMGIVQLKKFNILLQKRKKIAEKYIQICNKKNWDYQKVKNSNFSQNWFRFVLKGEENYIIKLKEKLNNAGVSCLIPIEKWQLQSVYLNLDPQRFKNSEEISKTTLSLPIFPDLLENRDFDKSLTLLEDL
jgi:perosamine synthetase